MPSSGEISICVVYMYVNIRTQIFTASLFAGGNRYCLWELRMGVLTARPFTACLLSFNSKMLIVKVKGLLSIFKDMWDAAHYEKEDSH